MAQAASLRYCPAANRAARPRNEPSVAFFDLDDRLFPILVVDAHRASDPDDGVKRRDHFTLCFLLIHPPPSPISVSLISSEVSEVAGERYLRLIAGSFVLASLLLGYYHNLH